MEAFWKQVLAQGWLTQLQELELDCVIILEMINVKDGNANILLKYFKQSNMVQNHFCFCLASIPSLYAYQKLNLYSLKHIAFSTVKLWLFNVA